ncbi:16S rRNA (guanine(527)-N(7))-methyltransferase RsmG [Flavobacteriaceae bacterium M23B6Z8]
MQELLHYFPELSQDQLEKYEQLPALYKDWNTKINVISRKDIDFLYERHILHSLGIAKVQSFKPGARILDVGTGGGFPGIPLAIMFPETHFLLVDAIGKKIKVVNAVIEALELKNIKAMHSRVEKVKGEFDFIVSRAVTNMPDFVKWVRSKVAKKSVHDKKNGILYLKGGDLTEELSVFTNYKEYLLSEHFSGEFFETKKVVYLPVKYKGTK